MKSVIILLIIVAAKAVFSAADTAFTYTSKFKISQESKKNIKARQIKKMLEEDYFNYQLRCAPARGLYLEGVYYE